MAGKCLTLSEIIYMIIVSAIYVPNFICSDNGKIKMIIRSGGHKHRLDDLYFIPGKGCKSPTILIKGQHKFMNMGKTLIIVQEDCIDKQEQNNPYQDNHLHQGGEKSNSDYIPLPIPIPFIKHIYLPPKYHTNAAYILPVYEQDQSTSSVHQQPITNHQEQMHSQVLPESHHFPVPVQNEHQTHELDNIVGGEHMPPTEHQPNNMQK